jgi:hypothetical protein
VVIEAMTAWETGTDRAARTGRSTSKHNERYTKTQAMVSSPRKFNTD